MVVALDATAALIALLIIKPMRRAFIMDSEALSMSTASDGAVEAAAKG